MAVSVIVETIGAPLSSGEMMVSLGDEAVSVRVKVAPIVAVCVIVTRFVTEIVEVVVEASQTPLLSFWGEATRFPTDPAVARVAMYAKAPMVEVVNFISEELKSGGCWNFLVSNQRAPVLGETERVW